MSSEEDITKLTWEEAQPLAQIEGFEVVPLKDGRALLQLALQYLEIQRPLGNVHEQVKRVVEQEPNPPPELRLGGKETSVYLATSSSDSCSSEYLEFTSMIYPP